MAAAVAAAGDLVVTARADNHVHGVDDLADTIARLQAYEAAGRTSSTPPGSSASRRSARWSTRSAFPSTCCCGRTARRFPSSAAAGAARVTVGGALAYAALGAVVEMATELREAGTAGYGRLSAIGAKAARSAFADG